MDYVLPMQNASGQMAKGVYAVMQAIVNSPTLLNTHPGGLEIKVDARGSCWFGSCMCSCGDAYSVSPSVSARG